MLMNPVVCKSRFFLRWDTPGPETETWEFRGGTYSPAPPRPWAAWEVIQFITATETKQIKENSTSPEMFVSRKLGWEVYWDSPASQAVSVYDSIYDSETH